MTLPDWPIGVYVALAGLLLAVAAYAAHQRTKGRRKRRRFTDEVPVESRRVSGFAVARKGAL